MPKGYWIVRVDIADPEQYKAYVAANGPPLKNMAPDSWSGPAATRLRKGRAARAMR